MNRSRGGFETLKLAIIFSVCDGDQKHFGRFYAELNRLAFPFFVNFDHCCAETRQLFQSSPHFVRAYVNDRQDDLFDESHRHYALTLAKDARAFDWVLQMDVDETLEKDAPAKIQEILRSGADIVDCRVLDLWGKEDDRPMHYRVDGSFRSSHREKFFNLRTAAKLYYYHPTSHAPRHIPHDGREPIILRGYPLHVLHWGIMDAKDILFHTARWTEIYTRAVGGVPYKFYEYINDPDTVIELEKVPEGILLSE